MTTLEAIKELKDINEYVNDNDVEWALDTLLKIIAKPDIPPKVLGPLIVQMQAVAVKLKIMAAVETHLYRKDRNRKNLLYTLSESLDSLVGALKYMMRQ